MWRGGFYFLNVEGKFTFLMGRGEFDLF
jgi:hypothetical protein